MSRYTLMLFIHVSGAVCLFTGMGIWQFGIIVIARAGRVEQVRTIADLMMLFGIVFLMTIKPALGSSIGAMAISALLGLASSVGLARARRAAPSDRRRQEEEAS
jgi:hypothetical protein